MRTMAHHVSLLSEHQINAVPQRKLVSHYANSSAILPDT